MGSRSKDRREPPKRLMPPRLELLFETHHETLLDPLDLGVLPAGHRLVIFIEDGRIEGPRLRGRYLPGTTITELVHSNGVIETDGQLALETDDGHRIFLQLSGLVSISPEAARELAEGRPYDPAMLYMRACMRCEANEDGPYAWLNRLLCVAEATRTADTGHMTVWQIL